MRKRWLIYITIGLGFGIVDWYFIDFLLHLVIEIRLNTIGTAASRLLAIVYHFLNFGIWLVPLVPAAVYEMNRSLSPRKAALSGFIIWVMAIFSYYAYYTYLLMFVGFPTLGFMLFSNRQSSTYWAEWWLPFRSLVLGQFIEWIGVAVIGGPLVGALSAFAFNFASKRFRPGNRAGSKVGTISYSKNNN